MGEAGRNQRKSTAVRRTFKVKRAFDNSERYRINASNIDELMINIKTRFDFEEADHIELRNDSDSTLVQSDSDLQNNFEFLVVYNRTKGECFPSFGNQVPPREIRTVWIKNLNTYNIESVETMQIGKENAAEVNCLERKTKGKETTV